MGNDFQPTWVLYIFGEINIDTVTWKNLIVLLTIWDWQVANLSLSYFVQRAIS